MFAQTENTSNTCGSSLDLFYCIQLCIHILRFFEGLWGLWGVLWCLVGPLGGSWGPPWAQYHDTAFFGGSVGWFVGGSVVLSEASRGVFGATVGAVS